MVVVLKGHEYPVVIIRFDVEPETHQALVNAGIDNTEKVMKMKPGFVSASFHKSIDSKHILNYAQWKSREKYHESLTNMTSEKGKILEINRAIIEKSAIDVDINFMTLNLQVVNVILLFQGITITI